LGVELVALGAAWVEVVDCSPAEGALVGTRDDMDGAVETEGGREGREEEDGGGGSEVVRGGLSGEDLLGADEAGRLREETGAEEAGASDVLDVPDDEVGLSEDVWAEDVAAALDSSCSDDVGAAVDCWAVLDCSVVREVGGSWLEGRGAEDEGGTTLLVSSAADDEGMGTAVDEVGSSVLEGPSESEGVEAAPSFCRLPSTPEGTVSGFWMTLMSSGQYSG
jgi:hypothetical protein